MATDLLNPLRDYLISVGIVRKPSVAGVGAPLAWVPPLWVEPRNGVPAPGESIGGPPVETGLLVVVGVFESTGIAPDRHEGFIRDQHVDFRLRSKTAVAALEPKELIRQHLNDRRSWDMAGLHVEESLMFRDWQRLGSDDQSFDWVAEFSFTLWGPPAVPETF